MSGRLTDGELADVSARVAAERCHACNGRGQVKVATIRGYADCATCSGTGAFALSTQTMASIVRELCAARALLARIRDGRYSIKTTLNYDDRRLFDEVSVAVDAVRFPDTGAKP